MTVALTRLLPALLQPGAPLPFGDPADQFDAAAGTGPDVAGAVPARNLNAAFLLALAGPTHAQHGRAGAFLSDMDGPGPWGEVAGFYQAGRDEVRAELSEREKADPDFAAAVAAAADLMHADVTPAALAEALWKVWHPEAAGIEANWERAVADLRGRRVVRLETGAAVPPVSPTGILFTANALLTVPAAGSTAGGVAEAAREVASEPQRHWYDHPIPIGVAPEANEILYGLTGLDRAVAFEIRRGTVPPDYRAPVVLSVSTTHHGLQPLARPYLSEVLSLHPLRHLDVYAFTEADVAGLVDGVLAPAAAHWLAGSDPARFDVLGVDGSYGRHYSFLKAVAALWSVLIDDGINATFKIDLDQVFPQDVLVAATGRSAFELLAADVWGRSGVDCEGRPVDLGMAAGALVNEWDIGRGLFTPDVAAPGSPRTAEEFVFYSALPQALSTEAEMMARYADGVGDGIDTALERVHVTGGTTGIRVDALRRYRPFTPSFIGRAEDQAYAFSVFRGGERRLASAHVPGLIMRHDKAAFAADAIAAARVDKLVGDHVRIVLFSAYGRAVDAGGRDLKRLIDPFTGSFVSRLPRTVAYLRLALTARSLFASGAGDDAADLIQSGARRIRAAFDLVSDPEQFGAALDRERRGWDLYYDTIAAIEDALADGDASARQLRSTALRFMAECRVVTSPDDSGGYAS